MILPDLLTDEQVGRTPGGAAETSDWTSNSSVTLHLPPITIPASVSYNPNYLSTIHSIL